MPDYRVRWEIDVIADTPLEAVQSVLAHLTPEDDVFEVTNPETGEMTSIDLELIAGVQAPVLLTPDKRRLIARLICEVEYLRETADIRDSMKNEPTLTQEARRAFDIPDEDIKSEDA